MKHNQKGFGAIEALLFLILLSILGFTGYYVWHTSKNANSTYSKASDANSSVLQNSSKPTLEDAVKQAQVVYDADSKAITSPGPGITSEWGKNNAWAYDDLQFINAHKTWFTDRYVASENNIADNQLDASGGFLECINALMQDMTVKDGSLNGNDAVVNVTENGQSIRSFPVHMKYAAGKWLIDVVDLSSCS